MTVGQTLDAIIASPITWGVLAVVAIAIALAGKFSMSGADSVLFVAWGLAVIGIYRAQPILEQPLMVRALLIMFLGSAAGLALVALGGWLHPEVQLTFKDSPLFTKQVQHRIQHDITRYQDYLARLGIPIPKQLPPVRVQTGPNSGQTGSYTPNNLPQYRWEMVIGENSINDPMVGTDMYGSFLVGSLVNDPKVLNQFGDSIQALIQPMMISQNFSTYFNTSFWNKKPSFTWPWAMRLWKVRDKLGAEFTDRMVAYALMAVVDNPKEGQETKFDPYKNFDVYVCRKLKIGNSVIDNESRRWPEIANILKEDGAPIPESAQ